MGFLASLSQTRFKRKINEQGVIDSNSVIFNFLLPSLFAAIFSAVLQGVGQSATSASITNFNSTANSFNATATSYGALLAVTRSETHQGGFQMAGWAISIGCGAVAGGIIGLIYRLLNDSFEETNQFFSDATLYEYPKVGGEAQQEPARPAESSNRIAPPAEPVRR